MVAKTGFTIIGTLEELLKSGMEKKGLRVNMRKISEFKRPLCTDPEFSLSEAQSINGKYMCRSRGGGGGTGGPDPP